MIARKVLVGVCVCILLSLFAVFVLVETHILNGKKKGKEFQVCLHRKYGPNVCFTTDSMESASENISGEYKTIDISNHSIPILRKGYLFSIDGINNIFIDNCNVSVLEPGAFEDLGYLLLSLDDNNLTRIEYGVFTGQGRINSLYIRGNKIDFIHKDAFANMTNLQLINLSRNRLKKWNPDWFVTNWMALIHFDYNLFEELPESAFAYPNVPPLSLTFTFNKIKTLYNDTFKGAQAVNTLHLSSNELTEFRIEWLGGKFVYRLDISNNSIECLSENFTDKIDLCTMYNNNPYSCSCVKRLREHARKNNKCYQDSFEERCPTMA